MHLLRTHVRHVDGGVIVALIGELDLTGADAVRDTVRLLAHRYDRDQVVFDCSKLTFVDSAGLIALARSVRPLVPQGTPTLRSLGPLGTRVLTAIGLDALFDLQDAAIGASAPTTAA